MEEITIWFIVRLQKVVLDIKEVGLEGEGCFAAEDQLVVEYIQTKNIQSKGILIVEST